MKARRYVVEGRVQGVWFRDFTRRAARRFGVVGWVRNRDDGTVEVEAAASEAELARFESELRQGPPAARVDAVHSEELARSPAGSEFTIVY